MYQSCQPQYKQSISMQKIEQPEICIVGQKKQKQEIMKDNCSGEFQKIQHGSDEQQKIFEKICEYLQQKQIGFKILQHEATRTSEQSASIRKTPLQWGAKTMLVTGSENNLILLIYRASRKVSWKKIRKINAVGKKSQMAQENQVLKLGVKPGGVPPFPHLIGLKGILDVKFKEVEDIAFNAGLKCKSIIMKTKDFPLEDLSVDDITQD